MLVFIRRVFNRYSRMFILKVVIVIKTECSKPYVKLTTTKMLIFVNGYTNPCKSCLGGGNEN